MTTKRLKLAFVDEPYLSPQLLEPILSLPEYETTLHWTHPVDAQQQLARARGADVLCVDVISRYDEELLSQLPDCKAIVTMSVGLDHIDVAYCATRGIRVIAFPGFNANAVAEAALGYMLALMRRIPDASRHVGAGGWNSFGFEGRELANKTLGVVGAGHVGERVISLGQALGMQIACTTAHPSNARARGLGIDDFASLQELLKQSDVIVLALPANAETSGIIGAEQLTLMKKDALLINVARPQLVDIMALAQAIHDESIGGAALDFVSSEPYNLLKDHILIQEFANSPNVVLLPHIAFNTRESLVRLSERMTAELRTLAHELP